ncbi:MAG: hemerythrin domain-containing protein [Rubrobacteraceae bacterium]
MKRHPHLREFSDDHHQGLVNALRLKRAASGEGVTPAEAARAFLKFWQEDTRLHFRKEEEVLLPVLARHGGNLRCECVIVMLSQHARIRGLTMQLGDEVEREDVQKKTLQTLGEQLEAHIRLEERALFPALEESLSKEALAEVSSRLLAYKPEGPIEP